MKKALITGITGQDGSYLTEILLEKGYEVHGIIRRSSSFNTGRIDHLYSDPEILNKRLFLHYGDVIDASSLNRLLEKIVPDEIYNLAAQSHVKVSFEEGCAGTFVFSYTDDWFAHGWPVEVWGFGLTRRGRDDDGYRPKKPAFDSVRGMFKKVPQTSDVPLPMISVVLSCCAP